TAEASVVAVPDVAYLSIGVQTRTASAQAAQARNDEAIQRVITAIRRVGIADADVETTGLSLGQLEAHPDQVAGYRAHSAVRTTVSDVSRAGSVLDAAIGAGGNVVDSITFSVKDRGGCYRRALAQAMAQARAKADAIADAMGATVVGVQSVREEASIA